MSIEARKDVEQYIKEHAKNYFQRDKSGKGYICPICGSGSGRGRHGNGTGITENKKSPGHFTCWAGCFTNADIFEIIGKQYGLSDFNEIFNRACDIFGVTPYDDTYTRPSMNIKPPAVGQNKIPSQSQINTLEEKKDFTEFYKQAAANIGMTDYYRGLGLETLKKFHVGFMPEWRANEKAPTSPRLIIPINRNGYLARDIRADLTPTQEKYKKMRTGKISLFNAVALSQEEKPVFIVEGEIDALSIIDAGGQAVALCGTANINKLITAVKEGNVKAQLIIQLDSDKAGQEATAKLEQALKEAKFFSYRHYRLPSEFKDANEFLMNDPANFMEWVKAGEHLDFPVEQAELEHDARIDFEKKAVAYRLNKFMLMIEKNQKETAISTGFKNLDDILDGGFHTGLYVIGANSSTGKTSLLLQIADNVAQAGHRVLFFSLEMSGDELTAKSLSRLSALNDIELYNSVKHAKTTRDILSGKFGDDTEREIVKRSFLQYSQYGQRLYVTEGIGDVGVQQIKAEIEECIESTKERPVVIIDYLQVLSPYSEKMTDKQNTDKNVVELKRMSRDFDIPVFGISSFNRENYKNPVSMASFKESGAIEYTSDVLIGLQYKGWDFVKGETEPARLARLEEIRENMRHLAKSGSSQPIQAKILKNRNGNKGDLFFEYYPRFNLFRGVENFDK